MGKKFGILIITLSIMVFTSSIALAEQSYTVQQGDNLWRISRTYGVTVEDITKANNITGELIQPGDVLIIPTPNQPALNQTVPAPMPTPAIAPPPQGNDPSRGMDFEATLVKNLISAALKHQGTPYHYGGTTTKGFDCSGFVRYTFGEIGIDLPHSSRSMASMGTHVEKKDLRPGDAVFFTTNGSSHVNHVGIYVGDNHFIHSSTYKGVIISSLTDGYYQRCYYGARRMIGK